MIIQEQAAQMAAEEYPLSVHLKDTLYSYPVLVGNIRDAFIKGYTASKWIEVKEGCDMPDKHEFKEWRTAQVQLSVKGMVFDGYYNSLGGWWEDAIIGSQCYPEAWQPLPEPFKKEVENG